MHMNNCNNYEIIKKEYKFTKNYYKRNELSKKWISPFDYINDQFESTSRTKRKITCERRCLQLMRIPRRIDRQDKQTSSEQILLIEKDYKEISGVVGKINSSSRRSRPPGRFYLEGLYLNIENHHFIINGYDYFNFERVIFNLKTYLNTDILSCTCCEENPTKKLKVDLHLVIIGSDDFKPGQSWTDFFGASKYNNYAVYGGVFKFYGKIIIVGIGRGYGRYFNNFMKDDGRILSKSATHGASTKFSSLQNLAKEDTKPSISIEYSLRRFGNVPLSKLIKDLRQQPNLLNNTDEIIINSQYNDNRTFGHTTIGMTDILLDNKGLISTGGFGDVYISKKIFTSVLLINRSERSYTHRVNCNIAFKIIRHKIHVNTRQTKSFDENDSNSYDGILTELCLNEKLALDYARSNEILGYPTKIKYRQLIPIFINSNFIAAFFNNGNLIIAMDLADLSLAHYLKRIDIHSLSSKEILENIHLSISVLVTIVETLVKIDKILPNCCHGDIKPDNILLKKYFKRFDTTDTDKAWFFKLGNVIDIGKGIGGAILSYIDKMTYYICHLLDTESNQLEKYSWYASCFVGFMAIFLPFISLAIEKGEDKGRYYYIVQTLCIIYSIIISIFTIYNVYSLWSKLKIKIRHDERHDMLAKNRLDHHKPYLKIYLTDFGSAGTDESNECQTSKYSGTVLYSSPNRIRLNSGFREYSNENFALSTCITKTENLKYETTTNASASNYFTPRFHGQADDAWALALTLIELITGKLPINRHNPFRDILKGKSHFMEYFYQATKPYKSHIPAFIFTLLDKCLENDPKKRWTFRDIIAHPDYAFMKKNLWVIRPPFRDSVLKYLDERQFFEKEKLSKLDECTNIVLMRSLLGWLIVFNLVIVQVLVVFLNFL